MDADFFVQGDKMNISQELNKAAKEISLQSGFVIKSIDEKSSYSLAQKYSKPISAINKKALSLQICPSRYVRNLPLISMEEQLLLADSKVAVVGAGGLGGNVVMLLARAGIGHLKIIDYDNFDEYNLNRQLFCNSNTLGISKSKSLATTLSSINPGVEVEAINTKMTEENAKEILSGVATVVDALDNIEDRFIIERCAKTLKIPLIHGAVSGFEGRVMTIFPEDEGIKLLYGKEDQNNNIKDLSVGIPAVTPATVASFQAMEVIKVILKRNDILRNAMLYIDMASSQIEKFKF